MSNINKSQGQKRHLFVELSEESYGLLMKNQLQKSLEKILEAENQLYKRVSKIQMKKLNVEISNMYYIKGLILDRMKDLSKSLLAYQRAFEENRNNKSICNNIGKLYLQLHNYEEAERYLHWALQIDDKLLQAYVNLAYLYFEINNFETCILISLEALQRNLHDYMLHEYLGICYAIERKNYTESLTHLREYMNSCTKYKFKPSFLSLYHMAHGLFIESKYDEALKNVQNAISLYPLEREALFLKSQILYFSDSIDQAEEVILNYAENLPIVIPDSQINSHLICDQELQQASPPSESLQISQTQEESVENPKKASEQSSKIDQQEKNQQSKNNRFVSLQIETEQSTKKQEEMLNVYFLIGLIYKKKAYQMQIKARSGDIDQLFNINKLQQKSMNMFENAKQIDSQFPIIFNLGLLYEQMDLNEESYKILQRTLILHFEKSNDELYLNNYNYHTLNKILLNIFKLNFLQKYQSNLNTILDHESDQPKQKLSIDSNKNAIPNCENIEHSSSHEKYVSEIQFRKKKISAQNQKSIKQKIEPQINIVQTNISATKEELIDIILNQLNSLNKQKLILNEKTTMQQLRQTVTEIESSFIAHTPVLLQGYSNSSQIVEESSRSNLMTSCLKSCDDWQENDQIIGSDHCISDDEISSDSPTQQQEKSLIKSQGDYSDNRILSQLDNSDSNQNRDINKSESYIKKQKQLNQPLGNLSVRKLSKRCKCNQENLLENENTNLQNEQKCEWCQNNEEKEYIEYDEEEEEEEDNEELKQQKKREQEKEKIIKNARMAFEKQCQQNYERIQLLKLEANKKQEDEYQQEKKKLYNKIKLIQLEYDNIYQIYRSIISSNKNLIEFSPECQYCNPICRISDSSTRDDSTSKTSECLKDSNLEQNLILQQSNKQRTQEHILQNQAKNVGEQPQLGQSPITTASSTKSESKQKTNQSKLNCECEQIRHKIANFDDFLIQGKHERDFFFAFKRVIKNTFLQCRYIIDNKLYSKSSITISSLAEMSLGFIPLFQSDLLMLDKDSSQTQIINNEDIVNKCYFVISLSDSIENLYSILDALSSTLTIYLSEYICEYSYNIQNEIYPDMWGIRMNQVLALLKNSYEISFENMGESYAYFIFYQFFAKFATSSEDNQKYVNDNHIADRPKFLFNFIQKNVKFSPLEFFNAQMNPHKEDLSPQNNTTPPNKIRINISNQSVNGLPINQSNIKTLSNYGQSETLSDQSVTRKSSKKSKRDQQQNHEKCLCRIF